MTDKLRAAAEAALDAIEELEYRSEDPTANARVKAENAKRKLRAALAEQEVEPEPVAWRVQCSDGKYGLCEYELYSNKQTAEHAAECYIRRPEVEPLYTAPPRREWQSLTQEELEAALGLTEYDDLETATYMIAKANAIEAALKEKNG